MTRKEAIKILREAHDKALFSVRTALETLIPELFESEDERIRKFLIDILSSGTWKKEWPFSPADCVAYLEKQKVNTEGDFARGYDCGYECCLNSHGAEWLEMQKEQKPVKLNDDTEVGLDRALQIVKAAKGNLCGYQSDDGIYECDHAIQTLERILKDGIEQKPAEWSEEDEENFKWFDKLFRAESVVIGGKDIPQDKYIWFKSLRPSWKPSKKQMEALEKVRTIFHNHLWDEINPILYDYEELMRDLKSLRSRPKSSDNWKPSEEQMDALMRAITWLVEKGNHTDSSTLADLRCNLRKLM